MQIQKWSIVAFPCIDRWSAGSPTIFGIEFHGHVTQEYVVTLVLLLTCISSKAMLSLPGFKQLHAKIMSAWI